MKGLILRNYDLNGVAVTVVATEPAHVRFLDPILAPFAVDTLPDPDWTITVRATETIEPAPVHARRIWDRPLPEGLPSTLVEECGHEILVVPGHFAMTSVRSARSTDIDTTPAGVKSIGGTAAYMLLQRIFAAHGRLLLHGACLVRPTTHEAFALFAPSGTGKTTTALALARMGLEFAGDDALVLEKALDGFYLWGIPRKIKVDQRTARLLPWLHPVLADWTSDEQVVDFDALDAIIPLANGSRRRAAGAIVLLQPNAVGHRVEAIKKVDALSQIVTDNLRQSSTGVNADNQAAFADIASFIGTTPTVAVSVGPDPNSLTPASILAAF